MATVFDVAKYILENRGRMSTWKLQKLCYYCQAWHYTWTEHPLFEQKFEAWRNGPVCRELFNMHQGKFMIGADDIIGYPERITDDERESIDAVLDEYGNAEPYDLRAMTHREDPWRIARGDLDEDASCDREITMESMGAYYGGL